MQTTKLYDNYPYDTTFDAVVVSVILGKTTGTLDVVLDQTLFFPEEGGQTPDRGVLAGFPVVDVQIDKDGVITHRLQTTNLPDCRRSSGGTQGEMSERASVSAASFRGSPKNNPACDYSDGINEIGDVNVRSAAVVPESLRVGAAVHGEIDWNHRYSNMQNHSGEHVLSGLLHSLYGYENVGFRLSDHTVTLDTSGQLTDAQILDLERRANDVVYRNVPITCAYPPPEVLATLEYRSKKALAGPVRIVTIEGVDVCACCAPHVRRTGEIGVIKILNVVHNKHDMRLTIVSGKRAVQDYEAKQAQLEDVSHLTNYPQERAGDGVRKLLDEIAGLKAQLRDAQGKMLEMKLEKIRAEYLSGEQQMGTDKPENRDLSATSIWVFESPMDALLQRQYMNALCDMGFHFAGVFCGSDADGWHYLIGSRKDNANLPNKLLRENFHARGGGKPEMVQGSVSAIKSKLEEALKTF